MLRLHKYEGGRFREFTVSAQTHCAAIDIEKWIQEAADEQGHINNISIEIHGTNIPLTNVAEAYVIAALYATDHNDYVTRNLCYAVEVSSTSDNLDASDVETDAVSDTEDALNNLTLDPEYEQNADCIVNDFGPSHARDTDW